MPASRSAQVVSLDRSLWHRVLRDLPDLATTVYLALRTGPIDSPICGILRTTTAELADLLVRDPREVDEGLEELERRQLVQIDRGVSLVRLLGMPSPDEPIKSWQQLKGMWAAWKALPNCHLKFAHVSAIRAACDLTVRGNPTHANPRARLSMLEVWRQTFGSTGSTDDDPWGLFAAVFRRDGNICRYCLQDCGDDATLDHVLPRSRGGGESMDNLVVACRICNSRKNARTPTEARMVLHAPGRVEAYRLDIEVAR